MTRMPWWQAMLWLLAMAVAFSMIYVLGELIVHGSVRIW